MPKGQSLDDIIADGDQLIRVWTANPTFSLGDVSLASVKSTVKDCRDARAGTDDLRTQLTRNVNETNELAHKIKQIVTRARSGARAQFGPDSTQYEQLGGTRTSDRKPRKKKGSGTPKS